MPPGHDPPAPPKRPLPKPAVAPGAGPQTVRPGAAAPRVEGPRTTARPPPVSVTPGTGAPDPRALGLPPRAAPARAGSTPSVRPAPPRKLAQTLVGTGPDDARAVRKPIPSVPPRASDRPGPVGATEAGRRMAAVAAPDDEATHFLQRPAMPPAAPAPAADEPDDADPTRVISRPDQLPEITRAPALHLPSVVVHPHAQAAPEPEDEATRLLGSQSWPPTNMPVPGPAMPVSDPPPAPTVILKKNAAQPNRDAAKAPAAVPAPFVPPSDDDAQNESGIPFRTVSTAPLHASTAAAAPDADTFSLHGETTAVSGRKRVRARALKAAWARHRDKLLLVGGGVLAGIVLGFVTGRAGRSAPAAAPAVTAAPAAPAAAPAPAPAPAPTAARPTPPPEETPPPAPQPPAAPVAEPTPSATGRSISSLALEPASPAERRARPRTAVEPRRAAEPRPAPAAKEPEPPPPAPAPPAAPVAEPAAPAPAPRKGYVSPIQAPGF